MLSGPVKHSFRNDRLSESILGFVFFPLGMLLLGLAVVQLIIKAGWVDGVWPVTANDVKWKNIYLTLLLGPVLSVVSALQLIGLRRRLPKLTLRTDGIEYQTIWNLYWARWPSLLPFDIIKIESQLVHGLSHRFVMRAQIIGPNVSPNLAGKMFFSIENEFNRDAVEIVDQANATQTAYLAEHPDEKISLRLSRV